MSGGESDYRHDTLDAFRRCAVDGCAWNVHHTETRCLDHGGDPVPQYASDTEGAILDTRYCAVTWTDDWNDAA